MNPLLELLEHGQSYWLDNLTRGMIRGGELERRVSEEGLRGVTSNPAIFNKAITRSGDYDEQIERLVREGRGLEEIYEEIVVSDVRDACDVLRPVYDDSDGADGFVSLEVSPHLAHDTEGTVAEVRRLSRAVDRPNLLIKIPGTPEGVPAIEQCLFEGININVTLLFSIDAYEAVAEAYVRALERRREKGAPVDGIASVASFFLSRIDVLVDRLLGHRIRARDPGDAEVLPQELLGRAAVANAKLAYASFRRIFSGRRWEALRAEGARVQRMLWASTSTKNPLYGDVRYVEPLIGPHTVNTLPERTIDAFADHGAVSRTVERGLEEAEEVLGALEAVGIDFDRVTAELLHEGVQKFVDPYDRLISTLGERRRTILEEAASAVEHAPGSDAPDVAGTLETLDDWKVGRRIAARDPTVWARSRGEHEEIRGALGWIAAPGEFRGRSPEIEAFASEVRRDGIRHVLLLGMGGSVLGARTIDAILGGREEWPDLTVLDDTDPAAIREAERSLDLDRTLVLVASKSGTTLETTSLLRHFWARIAERDDGDPGERFAAITDPGTPLAREARERGFRACFENPPEIGGRYSVLSYVGLVPAALTGIDVGSLLEGAERMRRSCDPALPAEESPGLRLGALLGAHARAGRDKLTLLSSSTLGPLEAWLEQLVAESLGKEGTGIVPVVGEPPAAPASYGDDRLFVHLSLAGDEDEEVRASLASLREAGHPTIEIPVGAPGAIGAEFYRWELAVATAGRVLGVNPFDQPDVERSKEATRRLLEARTPEAGLPEDPPLATAEGIAVHGDPDRGWAGDRAPASPGEALRAFLDSIPAGGFGAILAFLPPGTGPGLRAFRAALGRRTPAPLLLATGPRYLHSTGQLHKGGPPAGAFLVLTRDHGGATLPVPDRPYDFATLHRAQALADARTLAELGRPVLRLHLGDDPERALETLVEALAEEPTAEPAPSPA